MNERTIIIENVSNQTIGLVDTQKRVYGLKPGAKVRVSKMTMQDILDVPGSKVFFNEGDIKISNVTETELYSMGLTDKEVKKFSLTNFSETPVSVKTVETEPEVVIEEVAQTIKIEEAVIIIPEANEGEGVVKVVKAEPKENKQNNSKKTVANKKSNK